MAKISGSYLFQKSPTPKSPRPLIVGQYQTESIQDNIRQRVSVIVAFVSVSQKQAYLQKEMKGPEKYDKIFRIEE